MEKVHYQQERMLAELKDLAEKGLFSQVEVRQIMKKRTAFETALIRHRTKKSDYLRYAAYEMSLEALRRKRAARLKRAASASSTQAASSKSSISLSDFALVQGQFRIFERAVRRFKDDVGLWIQYMQVAKRENAPRLAGRISARALQLHPNVPALYILAAAQELTDLSPAAARTMLQRGLRLNPGSADLWREYVRMELGFVEGLRRRWTVLGLGADGAEEAPLEARSPQGVEAPDGMDVDGAATSAEEPLVTGEAARAEVMRGALVKAVMDSAAKALPTLPLFVALHTLLMSYPCPAALRHELLAHLHGLLRAGPVSREPAAALLYATRGLAPELEGTALVDALRGANEELLAAVERARQDGTADGIARVYAGFVAEWCAKDVDGHLKLYLLSTMQALCASLPSPPLLAAHLRLLSSPSHPSPPPASKILRLARKYTGRVPQSAEVWLVRLGLEAAEGGREWKSAWEEARAGVQAGDGDEEDESLHEAVWLWGLERLSEDGTPEEALAAHETLLRDSMRPALGALHETLLIRYVALLRARAASPEQHARDVQRVAAAYMPRARAWAGAFAVYAQGEDTEGALCAVYERWRTAAPGAHADAALAWGAWLLRRGRGREASAAVARARAALADAADARVEFETRWRAVLDDAADADTDDAEGGEGGEIADAGDG